jgi:hypothetical protein
MTPAEEARFIELWEQGAIYQEIARPYDQSSSTAERSLLCRSPC